MLLKLRLLPASAIVFFWEGWVFFFVAVVLLLVLVHDVKQLMLLKE